MVAYLVRRKGKYLNIGTKALRWGKKATACMFISKDSALFYGKFANMGKLDNIDIIEVSC